ncbi:MAG: flagellin [Pirellulales bacterium]
MLGSVEFSGLSSAQIGALNRLRELSGSIEKNTERLTTLKRINSAKDDPSGLVQVSQLESELIGAEAALGGITQANSLLSTADSAAGDILTQLQAARTLALAAADSSISAKDLAAKQLELDSVITSIAQLSRVEYGSRRLLDGSTSFSTSGVNSAQISGVTVTKKKSADNVAIAINVSQVALQATDTYDNSTPLAADATITLSGSRGSSTITLSSGATTQNIVDAVNAETYLTGITTAVNGADVDFTSTEYGSAATIKIDVVSGTFVTTGSNSVQGTDTLATVNGKSVVGNGTTLRVVSSAYGIDVELAPGVSGNLTSFNITGEGLQFVIGTSATDTARFGAPRLTTSSLGNGTGKIYSLQSDGTNSLSGGNAATAVQIIDDAISQTTQAQTLIGSFQKHTLDSASSLLTSIQKNTTTALSAIQDVDIGLETALLANNQLLQQATLESLKISTLNKSSVLNTLKTIAARF